MGHTTSSVTEATSCLLHQAGNNFHIGFGESEVHWTGATNFSYSSKKHLRCADKSCKVQIVPPMKEGARSQRPCAFCFYASVSGYEGGAKPPHSKTLARSSETPTQSRGELDSPGGLGSPRTAPRFKTAAFRPRSGLHPAPSGRASQDLSSSV